MNEKDLLPMSIGMCISADNNCSKDITEKNIEILKTIKINIIKERFILSKEEKGFFLTSCDKGIKLLTEELKEYK